MQLSEGEEAVLNRDKYDEPYYVAVLDANGKVLLTLSQEDVHRLEAALWAANIGDRYNV